MKRAGAIQRPDGSWAGTITEGCDWHHWAPERFDERGKIWEPECPKDGIHLMSFYDEEGVEAWFCDEHYQIMLRA